MGTHPEEILPTTKCVCGHIFKRHPGGICQRKDCRCQLFQPYVKPNSYDHLPMSRAEIDLNWVKAETLSRVLGNIEDELHRCKNMTEMVVLIKQKAEDTVNTYQELNKIEFRIKAADHLNAILDNPDTDDQTRMKAIRDLADILGETKKGPLVAIQQNTTYNMNESRLDEAHQLAEQRRLGLNAPAAGDRTIIPVDR